jgi:hypothetical protein
MPGVSGATVVTNACVLFSTHAAAGAAGTRHSPRPLLGEGNLHNPDALRRGAVNACSGQFVIEKAFAERQPSQVVHPALVEDRRRAVLTQPSLLL